MWEDSSYNDSNESNESNDEDCYEKGVDAKELDKVFGHLIQECKHSAPGARLSARLRTSLERLSPEHRHAVSQRTRDGCAPLFVACKRGNVEIVEYLIHVCNADLEQRGVYEVPDDRSVHTVTPLWVAAVTGRLEVMRVLADAGADLDACSDSGSTAVRSACFMTHYEVVCFLVERGADIHKPNHNGGTCLINSVQSVRLCTYLLEHGAQVDECDMQLKTALHYAIQEHRLESARLLLQHGADPRLRSRAGDDALRIACLKGAAQIVILLCKDQRFSPAQKADAFELLGATQIDEFNDLTSALDSWRRATAYRHAYSAYVEKRPLRPPQRALQFAREWRSHDELEALAHDVDALRTQSLLVAERVLGADHKDTVFRLMDRGASYADSFRYQRCIDLWTWALEIRIQKETLLYTDTCHTACALTRLLLDAGSGRLERAQGVPRHEDVLRIFALVADHLPECRRALSARPVHKKQAETFDRALRCTSHLLHQLLLAEQEDGGDSDERKRLRGEVRGRVRRLVGADVRSAHTGDTLLHLAVSRLNVVRSTFFSEDLPAPQVFPSVPVVALLLECGADATQRNEARSTPLHVAAIPYNFSTELVECLLEGGAHLDQPNKFGDTAAELVALNRGSRVRPLRYVGLRCLAARAWLASPLARAPPPPALPRTLHAFLQLHTA